ncbi:MAG: HPr family phosphocarrier protein [Candidatus Methanomethylicaceae archaeon]
MILKQVKVVNPQGLHARPAIQFVQTANAFRSSITITKGERTGNAKSISQLMSLKVRKDDSILIQANGEDEEEAVNALVSMLSSEILDQPLDNEAE